MKKIMLCLLTTGLIFSIIGCNPAQKNTTTSGSEEIRLKWIMPGPGEQKDSPKVWAEFNNQLKAVKGFENVTVDFSVIPSADYKQKFLLLRAGGENIDIAQTYTLDFVNEVRTGTFIQIEDLIERNAPNLKKSMPDYMWNYGMVDSKLYLVPNYQQMSTPIYGLRTPTKLAEKYLDTKKMEQVFYSNKNLSKESYDVIEEYLEKLKANGLIGLGINNMGLPVAKGYEQIISSYRYKITEDKVTVEDIHKSDEYKLYIKTMSDWYKKGYIRKDVLSAKREDDNGKENGNAIWFDQTWKGAKENDTKKYGMDITVIPMQDYYFIPYIAPAGGNAIMSTCKNPDAAIKLLELMNSEKGKSLYNLLVYGIEGEHYTKMGEDKIQTLDYTGGATSSAKYGLWKWVVGNASMAYDTQSDTEGWKNYIFKQINEGEGTVKSKLLGFTPNLKPIETKLAQVNTVATEYSGVLLSGSLAEYEQHYNSFMEKLEKAGNNEVLNELQKQVDEFMAKKK